jgi:hypothetical protein
MCNDPACAVGEKRCDPTQLAQPQICKADRSGFQNNGTACVTAALCSAGVCSDPVCSPMDVKCSGAWLQVCNAGQTGFQNDTQCATAALCDQTGMGMCRMPACAVNQYKCMGAQLQVCNADRTGYDDSMLCASAPLCSVPDKMCLPPACAAGGKRCMGDWLQQCKGDRTDYEDLTHCAAGLCDPVGLECDDCVSGAVQCTTANVLQHCNTSGHWMDVQDCTLTSATCDASMDACVVPP